MTYTVKTRHQDTVKTRYQDPVDIAKKTLIAGWQDLITSGDMTAEEMAESLQDQLDGYKDMSLDDLTPTIANLMCWDYNDLTEDDLDEWRSLVSDAATEYLTDTIAY